MRQRMALARCLAPNPHVLLMDEPFAALDALTREHLYGDLQRIWPERSKTIVFVTHNVREALCLGDRIVLVFSPAGPRARAVHVSDLPRPRDINGPDLAGARGEITRGAAALGHRRPRRRRGETPPSSAVGFFAALVLLWQGSRVGGPLVAGAAAAADVGVRVARGRRRRRLARGGTAVTLRRLVVGYALGVGLGLPIGLLVRAVPRAFDDTVGLLALGLADAAERVLGAARAAVVRPDRGGDAVRRRDGHRRVDRDRDGRRGACDPPDLRPRRADDGLARAPRRGSG